MTKKDFKIQTGELNRRLRADLDSLDESWELVKFLRMDMASSEAIIRYVSLARLIDKIYESYKEQICNSLEGYRWDEGD